ncbi:MAG: redox-sensitive transcriptional activator SoxR [Lysobacterales bacterium]
MKAKTYSVGFVAKRTGVAVSALHFYEAKGLIHGSRNSGNHRRYGSDVIRRVSIIKAAQKLGVSLDEISQVFETLPRYRAPGKKAWKTLSLKWREQLNRRINALEQLRDSLSGCIGCGCLSLDSCPIYNPDDALSEEGPGPVILDRRSRPSTSP